MNTAATGAPDPATTVQEVSLALDMGGTTLKGAVVDSSGRTLIAHSIPTGAPGNGIIRRALALLRSLANEALRQGLHPVGIGACSPGVVNSDSGHVEYASSLGWTKMPVADVLCEEFGFPVLIAHDARAAGLAEARLLASSPRQNSVFVAIGTGVGAAFITEGTMLSGASCSAGELGHIPAIPGGERCRCGQHGCLEAYFSGAGLVRRYRAREGDPAMTAADIASGRAGEAGIQVWDEGIHVLALALATATLLTDTETIIIGGGLSEAGDSLLKPLKQKLSEQLAWRRPPALRRSELGPRAGQIGAAILGFQAVGFADAGSGWRPEDVAARAPLALGHEASRQLSLALTH